MKLSMNFFWLGVILADDFDGDALDEIARAVLLGFIDDPHAAFENFSDDLVPEFVLNCEQRHAWMVVIQFSKSNN